MMSPFNMKSTLSLREGKEKGVIEGKAKTGALKMNYWHVYSHA